MKLPFSLFSPKPGDSEIYLGLFLKEQEGRVIFIQQTAGALKVIANEKFVYTNSWENLTEDIDEVLYRLESQLKKSPAKTIFFVFSHLIDSQRKEIKKPYLQKIKELTKNLELKPLGYIECQEAVIDQLERKEGAVISATLLEFDKTSLGISVYKAGRLIFQETTSRTANILDDLVPVFEKIRAVTILPTRMILYNSKDLKSELSNILSYKWEKSYFVQLPKVEIVPEDELIVSLVNVFSKQVSGDSAPMAQPDANLEKKSEEVFGFVIGQEVAKKETEQSLYEEPVAITPSVQQKERFTLPSLAGLDYLKKVPSTLRDQLKKLPRLSLPIAGILLIVLSFFIIEYFFHTAKLIVFLPAQSINKELSVVGYENPRAVKQNELAVQVATQTADFKDSKATSAKKEIGEKAQGEVTIHNFDDSERTFPEGTILSAKDLQFVLSSAVKVASSSLAPDGQSKLPGKAKGKVVAAEIGPEGNLAKNQRFQIEDLSDQTYFAINDNAFSGGTKREAQIVAQADLDELEENILINAKKTTLTNVEKKIGKESSLIKPLIQYEVENLNFSNEVGEEADKVELKTPVKITYYFYKEKELLRLLGRLLEKDVRTGFALSEQALRYTITEASQTDEQFQLGISVKAKAGKKIDQPQLTTKVMGKKTDNLDKLIKDDFNASGLEVEVHHPVEFLSNWLPLFKKNIVVQISYL